MLDWSDADLIEQAQQGAVSAIGELYNRHHECIFRYVRSRVSDNHLAEDLTGEIFTRMLSNLPKYRPTGVPFRAWLYRIAHNLVVDYYRKEKNDMVVSLQHAENIKAGHDDPVSAVERALTWEKVQHALDKLDSSQREVVVMRFMVGLSLREVAQTLNKSVSAIKSLQHRGLSALRVALQEE